MAQHQGLKARVYPRLPRRARRRPQPPAATLSQSTMEKCRELGVGKIATVMGRYYAMDRDKRWDRLENAYDAHRLRRGRAGSPTPSTPSRRATKNGVTDEFVEPIVCDKDGMISDNDSVIFFNYRPDRAREITRAFVDPAFDGFKREFFPLTYVCNTEYDATMPNVLVAFPRISREKRPWRVSEQDGHDPAAHRRDREVRTCHVLLQRRRREPVSRRGPRARRLAEGRDLRPPARDERLRGLRASASSASSPASTTSSF